MFFLDKLPRGFIFFRRVFAFEIKPKLIRVGFGQEVGAIGESLDLIKLKFDQVMHRLDVGLESMRPRRNRAMHLAGDRLDGLGENAVVFGLPGADEFRAIVALPSGFGEIHLAILQALDDVLSEQRGISQGTLIGER